MEPTEQIPCPAFPWDTTDTVSGSNSSARYHPLEPTTNGHEDLPLTLLRLLHFLLLGTSIGSIGTAAQGANCVIETQSGGRKKCNASRSKKCNASRSTPCSRRSQSTVSVLFLPCLAVTFGHKRAGVAAAGVVVTLQIVLALFRNFVELLQKTIFVQEQFVLTPHWTSRRDLIFLLRIQVKTSAILQQQLLDARFLTPVMCAAMGLVVENGKGEVEETGASGIYSMTQNIHHDGISPDQRTKSKVFIQRGVFVIERIA